MPLEYCSVEFNAFNSYSNCIFFKFTPEVAFTTSLGPAVQWHFSLNGWLVSPIYYTEYKPRKSRSEPLPPWKTEISYKLPLTLLLTFEMLHISVNMWTLFKLRTHASNSAYKAYIIIIIIISRIRPLGLFRFQNLFFWNLWIYLDSW
jgi:hypothetical protein